MKQLLDCLFTPIFFFFSTFALLLLCFRIFNLRLQISFNLFEILRILSSVMYLHTHTHTYVQKEVRSLNYIISYLIKQGLDIIFILHLQMSFNLVNRQRTKATSGPIEPPTLVVLQKILMTHRRLHSTCHVM